MFGTQPLDEKTQYDIINTSVSYDPMHILFVLIRTSLFSYQSSVIEYVGSRWYVMLYLQAKKDLKSGKLFNPPSSFPQKHTSCQSYFVVYFNHLLDILVLMIGTQPLDKKTQYNIINLQEDNMYLKRIIYTTCVTT